MSHYHHEPSPGTTQLYDCGETVLERAIDLCDEVLADERVAPITRYAAAMAKDALGVVRSTTLQPERVSGPRRETVEEARGGVELISQEPIEA